MAVAFFPSLSTVISTDQIPEGLRFLSSNLNNVLKQVYFRDLQIQRSIDRTSISYDLEIISYSELLKLEIPGTGLVLLINPDVNNPNIDYSIIPISLTWTWGIQQYIKNFKISSFSFQPQAFHNLIFKIIQVSDDALLISALETFIPPAVGVVTIPPFSI